MNVLVQNKKPLGKILVEKGLLSEQDLWHALVAQQVSGERLGKILLGQGKINKLKLHTALAEHYDLEFVDLTKTPPDENLLNHLDRKEYLDMGAIPLKRKGAKTIIATDDVSDEVKGWAKKKYGACEFVITSTNDITWAVQSNFSEVDDAESRNMLWENQPEKSAKDVFIKPTWQDAALFFTLSLFFYFFFEGFIKAFFVVANLFYFSNLIFKLMLISYGFIRNDFLNITENLNILKDGELPVYTVLSPLYKEKEKTINNLVSAIRKFNYPKEKLDVKLIVESDDVETINIIKSLKLEAIFEIIKVPYSMPRTKAKALNYAIKFARGEYATIYDAEDMPEPDQLKKVLLKFRNSNKDLACVQARLNYYNRDENIITRMFSIEYSSWFDFMLPGLEKLKIPIPLGGTSNHFPIKILRKIYSWDPYNVTEDADIGMRLAENGYKTAMVNSITYEESPISFGAWIKQRSRWVKGYLQTYIVYMRHPFSLFKKLGLRGFFGFQFFVGAPSLVFISLPFTILTSLNMFFNNNYGLSDGFMIFAMCNLTIGILMQVVFALISVISHRWWNMLPFTLIFPFYWLLHSISSFRAVFELVRRPHYWEKTEHGLSKMTLA